MKAGTFFATCAVFAAFAISQIPASHAQGVTEMVSLASARL